MSGQPHGIIIAIEQYDPAGALPDRLPGTKATAEAFRDWLVTAKGCKPANIVECISETSPAPQTSKPVIVTQLRTIASRWQHKVSELYVYLSGHGVLQTEVDQPVDYLLTSEFKSFDTDGNAAIALQEMQRKLRESLGPGEHYYFVDLCRTHVQQEDISLSGLGMTANRSNLGAASYFTLFSVRSGGTADVKSGFGPSLVKGLRGTGRAKNWIQDPPPPALYVTFGSLLRFMKKHVESHAIDADRKGMGEGRILQIDPVVESECTIEVLDAGANEQFDVTISDVRNRDLKTLQFTGGTVTVPVQPDDYNIQVSAGGEDLRRVDPPPPAIPDLYDACTVRFTRSFAVPAPSEETPIPTMPSILTLDFPAVANARIISGGRFGGGLIEMSSPGSVNLDAGSYTIEMVDRGLVTDRVPFEGVPGRPATIRLGSARTSRAHVSIRRAIESAGGKLDDSRLIDFSETLEGPIANQDLTLWLALLAASRITADERNHLQKLRNVPLLSSEEFGQAYSPIYVVAGFEASAGKASASLNSGETAPLRSVKGLANVSHVSIDTQPGAKELTFEMAGESTSMTIVTHALKFRVTLVVVVHGDDGHWYVRQLFLPLRTHLKRLPPRVQSSIKHLESLQTIHASIQAQTLFSREGDVAALLESKARFWEQLLYGKWLDPVMSLIACYELLRRGRKEFLDEVIRNLHEFFPGLPDTEAIARLSGGDWTIPSSVPMFLDGALAMPELLEERRGLQVLDYRAPWTMWIGPKPRSRSKSPRRPKMMKKEADYEKVFATLEREGVLSETPDQLRERARVAVTLAVPAAAPESGDRNLGDRAAEVLSSLEDAIREELCDPKKGSLTKEYEKLLSATLDPKGLAVVTGVVLNVARSLNPALAVSSVGVYVAVWLLRAGLNQWCAQGVKKKRSR